MRQKLATSLAALGEKEDEEPWGMLRCLGELLGEMRRNELSEILSLKQGLASSGVRLEIED